ncbi:hypothetical protein mRhiFer1_008823 [Rhinolophus ferrumequinum]|uniref:Reverse transcriptase domain-containing protein n=1 Tax=Rhinolophus ferrumequinum TaxID=59479 RepID=A0A7J8AEP0_RHIFE|nr:hypothetical protein mRhiFer1_008823 [Rhinolophus ferrumequinum]
MKMTPLLAKSSNDLKQLQMKAKEESAKAGLYLNIKKTKIMMIEQIHNFNMNNKDIKIVKDFAYSGSVVINSNGDCIQEIKTRLRLRRKTVEEVEKIKNKDMLLETKAKTINPNPHIPNYYV